MIIVLKLQQSMYNCTWCVTPGVRDLVLNVRDLNLSGRGANIRGESVFFSRKLFFGIYLIVEKMTIIRYGYESLVRFRRAEKRGYIMGAKESPPDGMLGDGP